MILVLRPGSSPAEAAEVLAELEKRGCSGRVVEAGGSSVVHVTGGRTRRARKLRALDQVLEIVPTSGPRVRREGWRFFPYHFVNWSAFGVLLLGLLVFLAGLLPTGIGDEVDYSHPPEAVTQPWYVRLPLALAGLFPESLAWLGWVVFGALSLALLALPLLDRSRPDHPWARHARLLCALLLALGVGLLITAGGQA